MELGTGLYALAAPVITLWLSGQVFLAAITGSPGATIAVTIGLMIPPSLLIGFSVPLFSAYAKARLGDRPSFQGIYTAYNLGAFAGVVVVEFILVHRIGVSASLATLGAVNLCVGVVLLASGSLSLRKPNVARLWRDWGETIVLALCKRMDLLPGPRWILYMVSTDNPNGTIIRSALDGDLIGIDDVQVEVDAVHYAPWWEKP